MAKVNPFLEKKIKEGAHASPLVYVVEVEPGTREQVKSKLKGIPNLSVTGQPADRFIVVSAPPELVDKIADVPGVVKISAETVVGIKTPFLGIPTPKEILSTPSKLDPYLGQVYLSKVEVPVGPLGALKGGLARAAGMDKVSRFTTVQQREYIGAPADNKVSVVCAVADTGLGFVPLIRPARKLKLVSKVLGELPVDGQGHGTWCTTTAFGDSATHPRWGKCMGVANPEELIHIKCLSTMGFGMTSWILDAIYEAQKLGAKVLSMSLGGPLQGSALDDDPICRLITSLKDDLLCVVAAGNEGPDEWTIGSPGACPDALTVGAWSMTDNGVSWFSSRGPSGEFYKDNPDVWEKEKEARGDDMIKPDVCAPGGGRVKAEDMDEQILSGCFGWFDPFGDLLPGWGIMKGTSMATPAVAGLVALALDRGLVKTAEDVKRKMLGNKGNDIGYGLLTWDIFTS